VAVTAPARKGASLLMATAAMSVASGTGESAPLVPGEAATTVAVTAATGERPREAAASAAVTATVASTAHKDRRAAAAVAVAATANECGSAAATAAMTVAAATTAATVALGRSAAPAAAVSLRGSAATAAMTLRWPAAAVAVPWVSGCRGCDRQRGDPRGEKYPGQHGETPFERQKRPVRCAVPTVKRMELAA
jgi:hypothetical protein